MSAAYVDVHGTGEYLLTVTEPLVVGGAVTGVAGADVPVARFERGVRAALGGRTGVLVTDEEGRVVLSGAPRWLVGERTAPADPGRGPGVPVPGTPWRVHAPDGHPAGQPR